MPKHYLGSEPDGDTTLNELAAFESALHGSPRNAALGQGEQIERDIAEIERASAALRKGEPALEIWNASWSGDAPMGLRRPRPVWLLIGLLWLSTALVTAGAVAAIARLAG